jgi:hypothetical protein
MLHSLKDLEGFTINAKDGDIGEIIEFYFDDRLWVIRYLVVKTGTWLSSKKVLLSPISIESINREDKVFTANLSREQVKNSPDIDTQQPASRQQEVDFFTYYCYPYYWGSAYLWGGYTNPSMIEPGCAEVAHPNEQAADVDVIVRRDEGIHLRSSLAVTGYRLEATDGDLGHLQGILIDSDRWAIRHLIVNTSNWWVGHQVLTTPESIKEMSWATDSIYVDMTQKQIKEVPIFDPDIPFPN